MQPDQGGVSPHDQLDAERRDCDDCLFSPDHIGLTSRVCHRHWLALFELSLIRKTW